MSTESFNKLKNIYPTSITLCFNAVPVGNTDMHVRNRELTDRKGNPTGVRDLERDERLARSYRLAKEVGDKVHRNFIKRVLERSELKYVSDGNSDSVAEYADIYLTETVTDENGKEKKAAKKDIMKRLAPVALNLKKEVAGFFASVSFHPEGTFLKALSGVAFIKTLMHAAVNEYPEFNDEKVRESYREAVADMAANPGYMKFYMDTHCRIYPWKAKGNTIPNRIVDDNLPVVMENIRTFRQLPDEVVAEAQAIFDKVAGDDTADLREIFSVPYACRLLSQKEISRYNAIIGAWSGKKNRDKIKGLNMIIKEWNDKNVDPKNDVKPLPFMKKLKKQILTDPESFSYIPKAITCEGELAQALTALHNLVDDGIDPDFPFEVGDKSKVYISRKKLSDYSSAAYGEWKMAESCYIEKMKKDKPKSARKNPAKYEKEITKDFEKLNYIPLADIEAAVAEFRSVNTEGTLEKYIEENIRSHAAAAADKFEELRKFLAGMEDGQTLKDEKGSLRASGAGAIQDWLDELIAANAAARVFRIYDENNGPETDPLFYGLVVRQWADLDEDLVSVYNKTRNYLTRKPYSTEKFRLTFGSQDFLGGWDAGVVPVKRGVFLRRDGEYFVAVVPADNKKAFEMPGIMKEGTGTDMLNVRYLGDPGQRLPVKGFGRKPYHRIEEFDTPADLVDLMNSGKPATEYTREELEKLIDYYKSIYVLDKDNYARMPVNFKETSEYKNLKEFYDDAAEGSFKMKWEGIDGKYIDDLVKTGRLYLFKVTCQDMDKGHHGKDGNVKVLFEEMMSDRNCRENLIKLCGGAQMYFRKKSFEPKPTEIHPAGIPIGCKNPDNPRKARTFRYDIIKNRRFTVDRYSLHIPITFSPRANAKGGSTINDAVRQIIRENPGMYVLGVNRGERNLVSISVTAPDGTIVEQCSLNVFDNFDYLRKLTELEKQRNSERRNWQIITAIKNLKLGYLSRVKGAIKQYVKKYNCIIAMEALDMDFSSGRQKFERNVYRQFENELVNMFGLLLDKDDADRTRNALQLTNKAGTIKDRIDRVQNGIIFFVNPAWITASDPVTGFANRLDTHYTKDENAQAFLKKFISIRYDGAKDMFAFSFRYVDMITDKYAGDPNRIWTVYTNGERTIVEKVWKEKNDGEGGKAYEPVTRIKNLTTEFKKLLDENGVPYGDHEDLRDRLDGKGEEFYKEFLNLMFLTMRNWNWYPDTREHRVIGCTTDEDGNFFDSRTAGPDMPQNADTSAARNIARKAHIILSRIRDFVPDETVDADGKPLKEPELMVSNKAWFDSIQKPL